MPKYDAFGREIGEDTLEGLGGSSARPDESAWQERTDREEATWQEAERVEVARIETAADAADAQAEQAEDARQAAAGESRWMATARPQVRTVRVKRSAAGKGCLVAFVMLILLVGGIIAGIASLVSSVDIDTPDSIISRPDAQPKDAPKGLAGESLVRRENLARVLRTLSASEQGRLTNLRVAPERIDAQLVTSEGRIRHIQVKPGGKPERFGPDSGPGFDSVGTIPFSRLDPNAPTRLARRGAEEVGVPITDLQYVVPQTIGKDVRWVVYFTRSRYVIGDAKGRFQAEYPRP
jgi:hypothetical protein